MNKRLLAALFLIWLAFSLITINRHIKSPLFTYHSEIFSDKAGYYVYLPATFIYKFDASLMPENIEHKTGEGFSTNKNHIVTKYSCGVALLQLPFWLPAQLFSSTHDGFSKADAYAIDIAAAFYLSMGLFLCYTIWRRYCSVKNTLLLLAAMLFGTNLFYYGIYETGMSHIYSFFIISCLIYVFLFLHRNKKFYVVTGILYGILFLTRPINIVFAFPLFFIGCQSFSEIKGVFMNTFFTKNSMLFYVVFLFVVSPQLAYYAYLKTNALQAPYTNEGFFYLLNPYFAEVLAAPNNGIFLYCPLLAVPVYYMFRSYKEYKIPSVIAGAMMVLIIYAYASWSWYVLGCGYGHRSLVEFYPAIFLPMVLYMNTKKIPAALLIIAFVCICYTTKNALTFDGCYTTKKNDWDWAYFSNFLQQSIK